ncbi:MAG: GNAT family N-acetyltransferase [Bacteroidota bacterium]
MRLRRAIPADRAAVTGILSRQPALHLPLLAGLERLGDDAGVACWVLSGRGGPGAVLLYDHGDWSVANPGGADLYPFIPMLRGRAGRLRGEVSAVGAMVRHIRPGPAAVDRACLLVRLTPGDAASTAREYPGDLRLLDSGDAALLALPDKELAEGMARAGRGGRIAGLFADGALAALAWTEAEAAGMALLGGIYTVPGRRRQGWATACLGAFCRFLLAEKLSPLLAYDDPATGRLAGRFGSTPCGRWREVELQNTEA